MGPSRPLSWSLTYNEGVVLRMRKSATVLCLAIVLCVALMPTGSSLAYAILVPLPALFAIVLLVRFLPSRERRPEPPVSLFSPLVPRAPPA